jgi:hypothetical protein
MLANKVLMGPEENVEEAIKALTELGFEDVSDSIPWRELFPSTLMSSCRVYALPVPGARKDLRRKNLPG